MDSPLFAGWWSALARYGYASDADFEHFQQNSHTLLGTFSSSLPVGILVLLLVYWIGEEIVFLLPSPHREALHGKLKVPAARLPAALLALSGLLLGAWSHVAWDSFTHETGWVVEHAPYLERPLLGNTLRGYTVLQHLSTLLGLCVLLYAYDKWITTCEIGTWTWQKPSWRFYLWVGVVSACFVDGVIESHAFHVIRTLYFLQSRHFGLIFLTSFVRDFFIAICALAIGVKVFGGSHSQPAQPETIP